MIDLKQNTLLREIPDNLLRDEKVVNLANSLQKSLDRMLDWADKINYTMNLDKLDDTILEHLLWEKHITWSEGLGLATTREQKINLIRNAVELHRIKGTPYAIELVLESLERDAEIVEWFNYGGNPYHFLIKLNLYDSFEMQDKPQLINMINEMKNVRSWLEKIVFVGNVLNKHQSKHYLMTRIRLQTLSNPWAQAGYGGIGDDIRLDGEYLLNGDRFLNGFYNKDGPAHLQSIKLVMKVLHGFGVHEINLKPSLDGEFNLDGEIRLQNEPQNARLVALQDAKVRFKKREVIHVNQKQAAPLICTAKTMNGIVPLNGQVNLDGSISLNQALSNHSGFFRVKKSGSIIEEVAI